MSASGNPIEKDGIESFRIAAQRALKDQKVQYELEQQVVELGRLQVENKQLHGRIKELQTALEAGIEDRERVILFKMKRIDELQEKLAILETEVQQQTNGAIRAMQEKLDVMTQDRDLYFAKYKEADELLDEMRSFKAVKDGMQSDIDRLGRERNDLQQQLLSQMTELEKKNITDIQRMRKQQEDEVLRTRNDMHKMMTESLDGTTRRAVEENERLTLELRYQSSKIEKLVKQTDALLREKQEQRNNTDILSEMTETLSRKVKFYEKLFQKMHYKERMAVEQQLVAAQQASVAEKQIKYDLVHGRTSPSKQTATPEAEPMLLDPGTPWKEALETHLEARSKTQRSIGIVLQYNRFMAGGDHPLTPHKPSPGRKTKKSVMARRFMTAQAIETVRLPNLTETEAPLKFVSKCEYLDSTSPRRPRESPKTARL
ncbi:hypothetical protein SPRG_08191 [Saprolegnia parasitica CBS 223.65]|uniref:Cilia- and flagella-associated protein 157 n=1 Tax=Saprolegnia parasitica (strain CBS 223.65) TaxID=695850 RepID=A0A067C7A5_SAPPC|nr:hypothetical protein SPRG_08191 [Saprolegnia parasitica CBS 223.65]KDO26388.1 hypothetical protein SPRG_08191 [Saprolegnia parasitica CBS 223.65]|eukprot:XP_012202826.1 hypothetical protein SPRG_08191 [Saprolegnia parasitica CBS 223.65]